MPLLGLLESLDPLFVINSFALAHFSKHILNARHHAFQPAKVHVSTTLKLLEDLVRVLLYLILDVHLSTLLVLLLTAQCVVQSEIVGEARLGILELVIVEERIAVGNTQE